MKLEDLAQSIIQGIFIEPSALTIAQTNYLYLQPKNIKNGFITEGNAQYIIEKHVNKNKITQIISYADILIYSLGETDFGIVKFSQDFSKKIIVSSDFVIIKSPHSFLGNLLQSESGKSHLIWELKSSYKDIKPTTKELVEILRKVDIPEIFDGGKISLPPGNIPVPKEDFGKISIRKGIISNDNLIKRVLRGEIKVDGYFQRRPKLWDNGTKSRLIESLIMDIPIPPLYFDIVNKSEWLIIDGLQRISTIVDFYKGEFTLSELDFMPELNGRKYEELMLPIQTSLVEAELTTYSIQPGTPRTVRYKIFKNINTSALVLSRQEIRHAMNEDEQNKGFTPSRYVKELAQILTLYKDVQPRDMERMYDCELALRYVAFRIFFFKTEYKGNIADFLDEAMESMYSYPKNKLENYKNEFPIILKTLAEIFGKEDLFTRKMIDTSFSKTISGSLLEIWTYAIAILSDNDKQQVLKKAEVIRSKMQGLKEDTNFMNSIDSKYNNNIEMVKVRFTTILNLINKTLNDN